MSNATMVELLNKALTKSEFWGAVSFSEIFATLTVTLLLAMFMFYVYKQTFSGVIYNHNYNVSLVLMALITSLVILTISSNLILSLGMVGALSIVRFRTPVKEPLDIVFMFWAIGLGITTGARLHLVALAGSIFIGLVALLLFKYRSNQNIFLLIIHYEDETRDYLLKRISELDYSLKSKTSTNGVTELTLEVNLVGVDTSFVEQLAEVEGIRNVSLVSYNGNFVG